MAIDSLVEAAFEGDLFAQAVTYTLIDRGNLTPEQAIAAVTARYDYDILARHVIDPIENAALEELEVPPTDVADGGPKF